MVYFDVGVMEPKKISAEFKSTTEKHDCPKENRGAPTLPGLIKILLSVARGSTSVSGKTVCSESDIEAV